MKLATSYLGLRLDSPLMAGASPLTDTLDGVRRLEDAGAPCIVLRSLFEEQITRETLGTMYSMEVHAESFAEAISYFPRPADFALGPDEYLDHIRRIKQSVGIPVIGSINGINLAGWVQYAKLIEQAGADALELNVYYIATDPEESSVEVEKRTVDIARVVKKAVRIPVAVKLSPFFSSLPHLARQLQAVGADGLVLFNRFYQPDIDAENLEAAPTLHLSDSSELLLRLRWLAVVFGAVDADLAVSGGVHSGLDAIKSIMAGATAVQAVSVLLQRGPEHLRTLREEMRRWLVEHDYSSLQEMKGSMSLKRCPDPQAFSRSNYMRMLHSWRL